MAGYRAVIFDFFGTLTHAITRGPLHRRIARSLGCEPDAFIAALDRSFPTRCRGVFGSPEAALRWVCDQLGADPTPEQLARGVRARVLAVRADTRLRADAVPALRRLRSRGLRTAVVSDCAEELPAFLPTLPVAPLLDACLFSVDIGHCKPHPTVYATACERLGVAPAECLYVGDGGGRELTGASAAGMTAVRLAAPDLGRHLVFAPDHEFAGRTVRSLTEAVVLALAESREVIGHGRVRVTAGDRRTVGIATADPART